VRRPLGPRRLTATALVAALSLTVPAAMAAAEPAQVAVLPDPTELSEARQRLEEARAQEGDLADAVEVAQQRLAEAEEAVRVAKARREEADAVYRAAAAREEAAEARAAEANDRLAEITARLDAAIAKYQREEAQLRTEAREAYKRSTGGVAESEAVIGALLDEEELDVALNRVELLRKIASRQADTAAELGDLADEIEAIQAARAEEAEAAEAAADEAITAANAAQAALTKREALAQREAATLEAAEGLVVALAEQREDNAASVEALTGAVKELEERAAALRVTTTSSAIPGELAQYGNGRIPAAVLEPIGRGGHRLWAPAARAFKAMVAAAGEDGVHIGVTDSYRSFAAQVDVARRKGLYSEGGLAARPGTSNHGWGLALDLDLDGKALSWMRRNADRFGFIEDTPREPWHWGFHARP
jgi:zinc D-Ala-D-Ala carboxypeptidase